MVPPLLVTPVLADHPAVAEVAIVAAPDPKWGEVPKAYIGLKPGMQADAAELIEWTRQRLAHFKCPKLIEFGPLPKTSTGNVQKFLCASAPNRVERVTKKGRPKPP